MNGKELKNILEDFIADCEDSEEHNPLVWVSELAVFINELKAN